MIKSRSLRICVILALCISFAGCAGLQRKFTRKKKKEEKGAPVVTTFDYAKELRVDELYKKHFIFWKTSQTELVERMDASYKKRSAIFDQTIEHLKEMEKYITGPKSEELKKLVAQVRSIDPEIRKKRLSKSASYRMKQVLEKTRRRIDREFSYPKVKGFLELNKQ